MTNNAEAARTFTIQDVMDSHPSASGLTVCHVMHDVAGLGDAPLTEEQYAQVSARLRAVETVTIFNVQGKTLDEIATAGYTLANLHEVAEGDYEAARDER